MRSRLLVPALAALVLASACDRQGAYGDANSIIAVADSALWSDIEDTVYSALEPTIQTVRDEKTFTVTYQDPTHPLWTNLRRFRQMLLIGPESAPWIDEALDRARQDTFDPPEIVQVYDVWARDQLVTVLLTPETGREEAVTSTLDELHALYDRQYRQWATSRMFVSGADTALADTLEREAGFSLVVPQVYYWDRQDSVYIFRNDNPDPSELIRQVMVTWRTPVPEEPLGTEALLAWRDSVARAYYADEQVVVLDDAVEDSLDVEGREAFQIQAVWQSPPESFWPAAGPFILRTVPCPAQDRLYLLDAWLYAPGDEKYEYMIQLERILESFRCGET